MEITTKGINISLDPQEAIILESVTRHHGEEDPCGLAAEETGLDINIIVPFMQAFEQELANKI